MQIPGILLVIAALGDSVTLGPKLVRGRRPYPVFVEILGRQLAEPVINAGVGGDTSTRMLARLDRDVLARRPRVVLIMAGLNDAAWVDPGPVARTAPRVAEAEYEKNLTEIVARVKQTGASAVLVTPNPMTRAYKFQTSPAPCKRSTSFARRCCTPPQPNCHGVSLQFQCAAYQLSKPGVGRFLGWLRSAGPG